MNEYRSQNGRRGRSISRPSARIVAIALSALALLVPCSCSGENSTLQVLEWYGIVKEGSPFSSRPGPIFSQEVSTIRISESVSFKVARAKWWHKWMNEHTGPPPGLDFLSIDEVIDYDTHVAMMAFVLHEELTEDEQITLAKLEASRPESEFDRIVSEAYKWRQELERLSIDERARRRAALWKSSFSAEVRRRYKQRVR